MTQKSIKILSLVLLSITFLSCDKIGKKIENYDLFGLDQANQGIKMQEEKIKAARDYQRSMRTIREDAYDSPNILKGGQ